MRTTVIRHPLRGILVSGMVLILPYMGFWLLDIGGVRGFYDDSSYPVSLFLVPVMGLLASGLIFGVTVFPSIQIARWLVHKEQFTRHKALLIVIWVSMLMGGAAGLLTSGPEAMVISAIYVSCGAVAFWIIAVRKRTEDGGVNSAALRAAAQSSARAK